MATPTMQSTAALPPAAKGATRNTALDFTKGFLVFLMVFYHWFNYFIGPSEVYNYIRFLTPSFIFITGFIVANVYFVKYDIRDLRLPARLATRGLKIIAVFVALNALIGGLLANYATGHIPLVLVSHLLGTAEPGVKDAAFPVLVPIGELLLVCAALVFAYRLSRYVVHVFCLLAFSIVVLLRVAAIDNPNAELIAIGSLGIVLGMVPVAHLVRIIDRPAILTIAYVLFDIAVYRWKAHYALQVIGVCLNLAIIYLVGASRWAGTWLGRIVILLGKYSLFGYISQIAILQVLRRVMSAGTSELHLLAVSFGAAFILTTWSVMLLDAARTHSSLIDRSYKLVFA